ncbi:hypothetical protein MUP46_04215 [Patescibacteria group bacterium]|nr:hypothetical protein [Patescibacteria group bacterium]
MDAKKALIITWVVIGLLVAGTIGFFLGRSNLGRGMNDLNDLQGPGQTGGSQVVTPSGQPSVGGSK